MKNSMQNVSWILFLALCFALTLPASGQLFWQDDLDGTGPNLGGGDRDAVNHGDGDNGSGPDICGAGDYFYRTDLAVDVPNGVSITFAGFTGSYWRGEDLDGCVGGNPDELHFTGISITGRTGLQFTGAFAANTGAIWEANDHITVDYRIDGGAYMTGVAFEADPADPTGNGSSGPLKEDTNGDGTGNGTALNLLLTDFSFLISGTGTTLDLRITVHADGPEEFAFEDMRVEDNVASMPVNLTQFSAKPIDREILLQWSTASEENNDYFQVEHSIDGRTFNILDRVNGKGTTTELVNYNFIDSKPLAGTNYYRLKQVDYDGSFEYSPIASAQIVQTGGQVVLSPNPFHDEVNLLWNLSDSEEAMDGLIQVQMYDLYGKRLQSWSLNTNDRQATLDLSNLIPGTYFLDFHSEGTDLQPMRVVKL